MSAIAPITGRFKSRVFRDIFASSILGTFFGYVWWYGFHVPAFKKFESYNAKVLEEIKAENKLFLESMSAVDSSEEVPVTAEAVEER